MRRQTQHVLLAAGDEKYITPQRKLIQTEGVMLGHLSAVEETQFGIGHVELGKPPSLITENRFLIGAVQLVPISGLADALVSLNGDDVVPGQHLPVDTVLSPEREFRGRKIACLYWHTALGRLESVVYRGQPGCPHHLAFRLADNTLRLLVVIIQIKPQISINQLQNGNEVMLVVAGKFFDLSHQEKTVTAELRVSEVLYLEYLGVLVGIHVARCFRVAVKWVLEGFVRSCEAAAQVVAENIITVPGFLKHLFFGE